MPNENESKENETIAENLKYMHFPSLTHIICTQLNYSNLDPLK